MKTLTEEERAEFERLHDEYLAEMSRLCNAATEYSQRPGPSNRATLARAAVSYTRKFEELLAL